MAQRIAGPGQYLPPPQILYPAVLNGVPAYTPGNYKQALAAGEFIVLPAGSWKCDPGKYSVVQFFDQISGTWQSYSSARQGPQDIWSDGFNVRVFNPTGCNVAAVVTAVGSAYVQASTSVTAAQGNSTWTAVVGGQPGSVTISNAGKNYGIAPEVFIPAPPPGGLPMTAFATISGGSVQSISITNAGGGYPYIPAITILPSPLDPNATSITTAVASFQSIIGAGTVVAVLCTNPGVPTTSVTTLTITGAGTSATAQAVWMSTTTSISLSTAGAGYGANSAITSAGGSYGGAAEASGAANSSFDLSGFIPRPLVTSAATVSSGSITTAGSILDGGLFIGTAIPVVLTTAGGTTASSIVLTQGSAADTVTLQPSGQ